MIELNKRQPITITVNLFEFKLLPRNCLTPTVPMSKFSPSEVYSALIPAWQSPLGYPTWPNKKTVEKFHEYCEPPNERAKNELRPGLNVAFYMRRIQY